MPAVARSEPPREPSGCRHNDGPVEHGVKLRADAQRRGDQRQAQIGDGSAAVEAGRELHRDQERKGGEDLVVRRRRLHDHAGGQRGEPGGAGRDGPTGAEVARNAEDRQPDDRPGHERHEAEEPVRPAIERDRVLKESAVEGIEDRPRVDAGAEVGETAGVAVPIDSRQPIRHRVGIVRQIGKRDDQVAEEDAGAGDDEEREEEAGEPRSTLEERDERLLRRRRHETGTGKQQRRADRDDGRDRREEHRLTERRAEREDDCGQDEIGPAGEDRGVELGDPVERARAKRGEREDEQRRGVADAEIGKHRKRFRMRSGGPANA